MFYVRFVEQTNIPDFLLEKCHKSSLPDNSITISKAPTETQYEKFLQPWPVIETDGTVLLYVEHQLSIDGSSLVDFASSFWLKSKQEKHANIRFSKIQLTRGTIREIYSGLQPLVTNYLHIAIAAGGTATLDGADPSRQHGNRQWWHKGSRSTDRLQITATPHPPESPTAHQDTTTINLPNKTESTEDGH